MSTFCCMLILLLIMSVICMTMYFITIQREERNIKEILDYFDKEIKRNSKKGVSCNGTR